MLPGGGARELPRLRAINGAGAYATHARGFKDAARVRDELLAPLSHRIDGAKTQGLRLAGFHKEGRFPAAALVREPEL